LLVVGPLRVVLGMGAREVGPLPGVLVVGRLVVRLMPLSDPVPLCGVREFTPSPPLSGATGACPPAPPLKA